jgi:hypothetical protein
MTTNAQTWDEIMVLIVRGLINDLTSTYTYDDEKIQQLLLTCAQLIKPEIDFNNIYTIDIGNMTLSPDPIGTYDDGFINLVSMKTACLILQGELKNLAGGAVRVIDGPSQIDMSGAFTATKSLYDQLVQDYNRAKLAYVLGNVSELKVVFSAYSLYYSNGSTIEFG